MSQIRKVKLGKILRQYRIEHWVDDNTIYRQVTITKDGQVFQRGEKIGGEIGRKRQFIIDLEKHPNTLLFIRQTIWDGGIGLASPEVHHCIVTENFPMFEVSEMVHPLYLHYFFRSAGFYKQLSQIKTVGSAQKAIHERDFLNLDIPLPDLDTQKTIVARLHQLQSLHAQANAALARLQSDVKRLRQSILQQAIQGKLVDNTLPPGEKTGAELLADIRAEKERRAREQGKKPDKPLPPVTEEEKPFELPEGWVWCRLGEVCSKVGSGSTPKGGKEVYVPKGIKFFRSQNIQNEGLDLNDICYIEPKVHNQMSGTKVESHDILLNITGGSLGRAALVPLNFDEGNVSQHVCIIRPIFLNNSFLHQLVLSPYFQGLIFNSTTGAGREGLPKYNLENFLIPIPPIVKQTEIIEEISQKSTDIKKMQHFFSQVEYRITRLWQSEMQQIFKFETSPPE